MAAQHTIEYMVAKLDNWSNELLGVQNEFARTMDRHSLGDAILAHSVDVLVAEQKKRVAERLAMLYQSGNGHGTAKEWLVDQLSNKISLCTFGAMDLIAQVTRHNVMVEALAMIKIWSEAEARENFGK